MGMNGGRPTSRSYSSRLHPEFGGADDPFGIVQELGGAARARRASERRLSEFRRGAIPSAKPAMCFASTTTPRDTKFDPQETFGARSAGGAIVCGKCRRHNEHLAAQNAGDGHGSPGKLGVAGFFQKPIGCQAADRVANYSCPERQRSQYPDLEQRELPKFHQIRRQPTQKDPEA